MNMEIVNPVNPKESSLGKHLIAEYYNCDETLMDDENYVKNVMLKAAEVANATIVGDYFHKFYPCGVSGVVVISESHLSIHTWKEYRYCAIDIFVCTQDVKIIEAMKYIKKALKAQNVEYSIMDRGKKGEIKRHLAMIGDRDAELKGVKNGHCSC